MEWDVADADLEGRGVFGRGEGAGVAEDEEEALERAVGPVAVGVPCVVPAVVAPVFDAGDEIGALVAVEVGVAPLVVAEARAALGGAFGVIEAGVCGDAEACGGAVAGEVRVFPAWAEDAELAVDVAGHDVVDRAAETTGAFEDGEFVMGGVAGGVFEEPDPVGGLVGAGDDEVEVAVVVCVGGDGPCPEPDAEGDVEAGVLIGETVEACGVESEGEGDGGEDE